MVINLTKSVVSELAEKIRLERTFERELRPVFSLMVRDFGISVRATGTAQDATDYLSRFRGLLQNHYARTQRAFVGTVSDLPVSPPTQSMIDFSLLTWRNLTSEQKATFITYTNQRQMTDAVSLGRRSLFEENIPQTPETLARSSAAILINRFFKQRPRVIAQTETQEAAEATKLIEAQARANKVPFPAVGRVAPSNLPPKEVQKTWLDVGDGKVRATHKAADGQTVAEDELFNVGNSVLRFPGDSGTGAALGEIINCRCSTDYRFAS